MRYRVLVAALALVLALVVIGLGIRHETNAEAMERRLRAALGATGDSPYRVRVGGSRLNILDGSYLATDIEVIPDTLAFRQRREAGRPVRDRYLLTVASFRVTGLGVWGLLLHRLEARTAVAEGVVLEVSLDRTIPETADTIRRLPHEFFRTIRKPVRLDTFRLVNSEIRYAETAVDGVRPGIIRFARTNVGVYNLSNDALRPNTPVVIELHTLLTGSAPTSARFVDKVTLKRGVSEISRAWWPTPSCSMGTTGGMATTDSGPPRSGGSRGPPTFRSSSMCGTLRGRVSS